MGPESALRAAPEVIKSAQKARSRSLRVYSTSRQRRKALSDFRIVEPLEVFISDESFFKYKGHGLVVFSSSCHVVFMLNNVN